MYFDDDDYGNVGTYHFDAETLYLKKQEEEFYKLQRKYAQEEYNKSFNNKSRRKRTFEQALHEFNSALEIRCKFPFDDYLQPFPIHRHNKELLEIVSQMYKKFPIEKRFSYVFLKEHWNDTVAYYDSFDWYHRKEKQSWVTGPGTKLMEKFINEVLLPYVEKTKKYQNKSKATFIVETPKTPIIEPKKEEPIIEQPVIIETKSKGRPKGSKNKKQDEMKPPTHNVIEKTIVAALQDIIWYSEGLKANEIMNYINADESIKKKIYAKLHENNGKLWEKRIVGKLWNGNNIERFYPLTTRKGYFYNGEILSLSKLAETTGMPKQTLSYRISKGMNHIDAINLEIKENMRRK